MINDDSVFKKHKDCQVRIYHVYSTFSNDMRYRCFCEDHGKWLHTLTNAEAELLVKSHPDLFENPPKD